MNFASDNTGPAHPRVMEALSRANEGYARPYGDDALMEDARARLREVFEALRGEAQEGVHGLRGRNAGVHHRQPGH